MNLKILAQDYFHDVRAASVGGVSAKPKAQLTTPVSNLFSAVASLAGLGQLTFVREQRAGRKRPDFGVLHQRGRRQIQCGYIELAAPTVSVDTATWKHRKDRQWRQMAVEAEVLIVCNGRAARLYVNGEPDGLDTNLPYDGPNDWDGKALVNLLRRFLTTSVSPVRSVTELSTRLAYRTADLRDKLLWLVEQPTPAGEKVAAQFNGWKHAIHAESSPRDFADGISQVLSYGMVMAALSGVEADIDGDGLITVQQARAAIKGVSPVMSAAFGPLLEPPLVDAVRVELGHLETLISSIDVDRVMRSSDRRGEPWLYFYEDFLGVYDPAERKQAGVYYTPTSVVKAMVAVVDHLLVERFGLRAGFADPSVVTLDPAVGTGTFPLAVLDRAAERMEQLRGAAGRAQVAANLAANLLGFELLPGPYAVSHLRLTQRLRELDPKSRHSAKIVLTDTLESPEGAQQGQLALFGEALVLATEQNRAKMIKSSRRVTVVIGNPPYRRLAKNVRGRGAGGWMFEPIKRGRGKPKSLFDDVLDIAKKHTIFSHHASLYNLYVYFWRWAIWKAFEAHGPGPGIVAFVTGSSWLTGPGFVGLRQIVRESCDEVWVIDLGGDNKGASPEENVFAIETPVAVVVLVRSGASNPKAPARIRYRRVSGTRDEKLAQMERISDLVDPLSGDWSDIPQGPRDRMVPATGDPQWHMYPKLTDLFPWQQPGMMWNRTWPIAQEPETLGRRWQAFAEAPAADKPALFVTPPTGRNVLTEVAGLPRLVEAHGATLAAPVVRIGFRSFDRQWALQDPRLAALERPALWRSLSDRQLFMVGMLTGQMSEGPALTVATGVPDKHYFCGRGGKDIIPLFRDAEAAEPNLTRGLLPEIGALLNIGTPSPEDLAAYVYALLSAPEYQARFDEALATPGPRVPITRSAALWREAIVLGTELLWLHTYGDRLRGAGRGRFVPLVPGLNWAKPVGTMPATVGEIVYVDDAEQLHIGDGIVTGVRPEVWNYTVSRMPVVKKWLGYRTAKGAGRAASSKNPLDRMRPTQWPDEWNDELLDLLRVLTLTVGKQAAQAELLCRICDGPTIAAAELPLPKPAERKAPAASEPAQAGFAAVAAT